MAARYVEVPREEFEATMAQAGFSVVTLSGVGELVYQRKVTYQRPKVDLAPVGRLDLFVRVYSTVPVAGPVARRVGSDAIRVHVVHEPTGKIVWSARRVHRTQGWREHALDRMREAWREALATRSCPECGTRPLAVRQTRDKSRMFYSCVGYPECRGSAKYEGR